MGAQVFDQQQVEVFNQTEPLAVLKALGVSWTVDSSFKPTKSAGTQRITFRREATSKRGSRDFEMLVNQHKWYDTRWSVGGNGAVSFVMHLFECNFYSAMVKLKKSRVGTKAESHSVLPVPCQAPSLF